MILVYVFVKLVDFNMNFFTYIFLLSIFVFGTFSLLLETLGVDSFRNSSYPSIITAKLVLNAVWLLLLS